MLILTLISQDERKKKHSQSAYDRRPKQSSEPQRRHSDFNSRSYRRKSNALLRKYSTGRPPNRTSADGAPQFQVQTYLKYNPGTWTLIVGVKQAECAINKQHGLVYWHVEVTPNQCQRSALSTCQVTW